jgi:hypothetical protein
LFTIFIPNYILEEEMKAFVKILTLILLITLITGCNGNTEATQAPVNDTGDTGDTGGGEELTAAEQWAKDNGVGPWTPEEEDWAAIEAAAKLEGKVVVYSNSSKIEKLIEPWNELYPDIVEILMTSP